LAVVRGGCGHAFGIGIEDLNESGSAIDEMFGQRPLGVADDDDSTFDDERFDVRHEGADGA
jgi:hypothetical protein